MAVQWSGMESFRQNLERLAQQAPAAAKQAVAEVALDVQGRATQRAPVDTGHLRESASTDIVDDGSGIVTATVGFSATTPDGKFSYALIQHERKDFKHPKGGEAKYLENAVLEVESDFAARLSEGFARFLR